MPKILFLVTLCSVSSYYFHNASPNPSQAIPNYSPGDISSHMASDRETAAFSASLKMAKTRPMSTVAEILEKIDGFHFKHPAGQVGRETPYGEVLYEVASSSDVNVAIETGTWDGSGSSMALGSGLKDSYGVLFTIEAVEERWIHAEHNLAQYPVKCLLGVGVDSSELPTQYEVLQNGGVGSSSEEEWTKWLEGEKAITDSYPIGLIKPICERYRVDFVHIDGGEFAGPAEFRAVRKYCKNVRYIALDDTLMYKNKANYGLLSADPQWEIMKEDPHDRQGWAVFRRRSVST